MPAGLISTGGVWQHSKGAQEAVERFRFIRGGVQEQSQAPHPPLL